MRVEVLARTVRVTKGSFYWHFKDRRELLEILLREWEDEAQILDDALKSAKPLEALPAIVEELGRRNLASERGESPSDAAIFSWAALDAHVAKRTRRSEEKRMQLFRRLTGRRDVADLFYYAYHGFLLRRRRVPSAAGDWSALARLALKTFAKVGRGRTARPRRSRASRMASLAGVFILAGLLHGCTTMRIIRHRDPSADRPREIFPQRLVHRAERSSPWVIAPPSHVNFDTVAVRDVDLQMRPLAEYLRRRKVRAFVVVRDDTILYERYFEGYDSATTSSSFSVAKSITSALLGRAMAAGTIRSLDDPATAYVPELERSPAYAGVTLRQLLGMQSGIAYTRTNGSAFHDLRSDDARLFYTTNRENTLLKQKREDPPGARWAYKDSDAEAVGWVLARATGKSLARQLEEGIWKPVGTEHDASWDLDHGDGRESASSGLNATARDLARFGRLYLDGGQAGGTQVVPREWVEASTTRDTARVEPEVVTWWQMQHQRYWWIPLQNWDAERDFFADGSRGQRIYVHPASRLVIVQLANDSDQEFPFRKIVHAWMQQPFRYPTSIPNRLLNAARSGAGADSLKHLYRRLADAAAQRPAEFVISEAGMITVGQMLMGDGGRPAAGIAVLELAVERSPHSYKAREALAEGYEKTGKPQQALSEYREALRLSPQLAKASANKLEGSR